MTRPAPPGRSAGHPGRTRRWSPISIAAAGMLVAITLVAFAPALGNDFVNWDDPDNFLTNENFRGLGVAQIRWAWTTFHLGSYQPIAWMFASIEFALWELDPFGYHAASLIVHAVAILLLYALILSILRRAGTASDGMAVAFAAFAAAWYAVHPLRVEVVAWATGQAILLGGVFFAASVLAYLRSSDGEGRTHRRWLTASLLLFLASLLCKAQAVSLPLVLLVLDARPLRRIRGGRDLWPSVVAAVREKIWFFGLSLTFAIVAFAAKTTTFAGVVNQGSLLSRLAAAAYAAWFYLGKMVAPVDLVVFYRFPGPLSWRNPPLFASLLAAIAAGAALWFWRKRLPGTIAASLAFVALLAPVSGLVSISTQLVADRHTYLIAMPWAAALAGALAWVARRAGGRAATAALALAGIAIVAALTLSTRELTRTWRNSETLWTHALSHEAGRTMMAYNNLAALHLERGEAEASLALLRTALTRPLDPTEVNGRLLVHFNLAAELMRRGRFGEAEAHYREMAGLAPIGAEVHYRWGEALAAQGKLDDAIAHYAEALRLDPAHPRARPALDTARRRRGTG